ncbi:hypothetical protein PO909_023453 [Leuciscus waleckii]
MPLTDCATCGAPLHDGDSHSECAPCLGLTHARAALNQGGCLHCDSLPIAILRSQLALLSDGNPALALSRFLLSILDERSGVHRGCPKRQRKASPRRPSPCASHCPLTRPPPPCCSTMSRLDGCFLQGRQQAPCQRPAPFTRSSRGAHEVMARPVFSVHGIFYLCHALDYRRRRGEDERNRVTSVARTGPSAMHKAAAAEGVFPSGHFSRPYRSSSCTLHPVDFPDDSEGRLLSRCPQCRRKALKRR